MSKHFIDSLLSLNMSVPIATPIIFWVWERTDPVGFDPWAGRHFGSSPSEERVLVWEEEAQIFGCTEARNLARAVTIS